ncbi:MAG: aspartate racemase, partial [Desulfobacteraceae bacterium 4484_190.3]
FAVCPDNTIHQAFDLVEKETPIPWLHIADGVGKEAQARGFRKLGITGTKYLMTGPVYPETLKKYNISCELVNGLFPESSRLYFNEVIEKLKGRGCDAVVLGCTEIPLIVDPEDCPLPTLDSTRLLARAALRKAIEE